MGLLIVDELQEAQVCVLDWNWRQHQLMGCAFLQIDKLDAAAVTHQNETCRVESRSRYELDSKAEVALVDRVDLCGRSRRFKHASTLRSSADRKLACIDDGEEESIFLVLDKVVDGVASGEALVLKPECHLIIGIANDLCEKEAVCVTDSNYAKALREHSLVALAKALNSRNMFF